MTKKALPHAWLPGVSGNPKGRPKGAKNHATRMILALLEGEAEMITRTTIEAAKSGDMVAVRLILDRLVPVAKERPVSIDLPDISSAAGIAAAQIAIVQAVANGQLVPAKAAPWPPSWRPAVRHLKPKNLNSASPHWRSPVNLNQRLKKIEAKQKFTRPSKEQVERQLNNLLAANGLNREAAAIKYGSVGAFCHALLLKVDKKADSVPTTGHLTAQEHYLQLLKEV